MTIIVTLDTMNLVLAPTIEIVNPMWIHKPLRITSRNICITNFFKSIN